MLEEIIKNKEKEISALKLDQSLTINSLSKMNIPKRNFLQNIRDQIDNGKTAVIAEIKRHSPSKGYLRKNLDLKKISEQYENAGATCISVLTDEKYFKGSKKDLIEVKAYTSLPILRKDFIIDEVQIIESKYIGADCILLILAALSEEKFVALYNLSNELNLDVLVEVHDEKELNIALKNNCKLIGINNRDLRTFEVSIQTSINLSNLAGNRNVTLVSESGIETKEDIKKLKQSGIKAFLIGEKLITAKDPENELQELTN